MSDEEIRGVHVRLPITVARRAKADAALEGKSLQEWFEAAALERLDRRRSEGEPEAG